jgi:hypothetical protein
MKRTNRGFERERPFIAAMILASGVAGMAASNAATITTAGTSGVFDENIDAANQLDVQQPSGTLAAFKSAVATAYANNLGGVIDWETGVTATPSVTTSSNNTLSTVNVAYGTSATQTLALTFDRSMELYTNDINNQIQALSQNGASWHNAVLPQGTAASSVAYNMSFGGAQVIEIGAAMPSRSTFAANGVTAVNFRATATFSDATTSVINYGMGGVPGTGDTFLHFAAPAGETITSFSVTWLSETGGTLANGQRRPVMDDFAFILIPEPSVAVLSLAGLSLAFRRRR